MQGHERPPREAPLPPLRSSPTCVPFPASLSGRAPRLPLMRQEERHSSSGLHLQLRLAMTLSERTRRAPRSNVCKHLLCARHVPRP